MKRSTKPSITSRRTTKTIRVRHRIVTLSPEEKKGLAKNLTELRRYLKSVGAVPVTPAMKRRLIAAGAWGMPEE